MKSVTTHKALHQILTQAEKQPRLALDRGWFQKPGFCDGFFDRCEHQAFLIAPTALELARRAVEMAELNGDPHLVHRGHLVLAHAYIARMDYFWARKVLDGVRDAALACCRRCRSDWFRRDGDLLGELRQPTEALRALSQSLREGGPELDPDTAARIYFVRGIAYHHDGQRARAIRDAGRTLLELSLDSPRGFFLDSLALLAIYVGGGGIEDDRAALDDLDRFLLRIRGLRRWQDVRARASWVAGHLYARLGDMRRALDRFESARGKLLTDGLAREIVAVTIDTAQLRSRHAVPHDDSLRCASGAIDRCLSRRADLSDDHRRALEQMKKILKGYPECAFGELEAFRKSFIAPVPGRLGERLGPE